MSIEEIIIIAFALAADACTVGLAVGIHHKKPRQIFRLAFHFGLFQALLPTISALLSSAIAEYVGAWDHLIGGSLLLLIGIKTIYGAFKNDEDEIPKDLTRGLTMVGLSVAVSIDAFAVGFPLGLSDVSIPLAVSIIGAIAAVLTTLSMLLAARVSPTLGKKTELVAGLVLLGLAIKFFLEG
jgi:manganese efflux pump family protein